MIVLYSGEVQESVQSKKDNILFEVAANGVAISETPIESERKSDIIRLINKDPPKKRKVVIKWEKAITSLQHYSHSRSVS